MTMEIVTMTMTTMTNIMVTMTSGILPILPLFRTLVVFVVIAVMDLTIKTSTSALFNFYYSITLLLCIRLSIIEGV